MALTDAGQLYWWGTIFDPYTGYIVAFSATPCLVDFPTAIVDVACGDHHTLAMDAAGCVWAWGCNAQGQCGAQDAGPKVMFGKYKASQVFCGGSHSFILTTCGKVFAFGLNNWGQLGLGYGGTSEFEPVEVQALCDIAEIAGGVDFSIALDNHGRVFTFGAAQPVMQMMDLPHYSSVWCQDNSTFAQSSDKRDLDLGCARWSASNQFAGC